MCIFCNVERVQSDSDDYWVGATLADDALFAGNVEMFIAFHDDTFFLKTSINYGGNEGEEVFGAPIWYCPMCGRKLKEE